MITNDIYTLLISKPHNKHYMDRYIKFINVCSTKKLLPNEYIENHHILPKAKALFPEYKDQKLHPWNSILLTSRQHFIAHYILAKAYNIWQCWEPLRRILKNPNIPHSYIKYHYLSLIRIKVNQTKRGVFTRGYNEHGIPNVKDSTKKLLSDLKTKYYADPQNRVKAKITRSSDSYKIVNAMSSERFKQLNISRRGIPLSAEHKAKIIASQKEVFKNLKSRPNFKGLYVTPIGIGTSARSINGLCDYCKRESQTVNNFIISHSTIFTKSVFGVTFKSLGFYFIPKDSLLFEQFHELAGIIHPPEPNHVLWSELNDYLLREKLHP